MNQQTKSEEDSPAASPESIMYLRRLREGLTGLEVFLLDAGLASGANVDSLVLRLRHSLSEGNTQACETALVQ